MSEIIHRLHVVLFIVVTIAMLGDGYLPNPLTIVMETFDMPAWRALCAIYGSLIASYFFSRYILTGE